MTADIGIRVLRDAEHDQETKIADFVGGYATSSLYHSPRWVAFAAKVFSFDRVWITATDTNAKLVGVLPMIRQTSLVFGSRWVSLPFFNYGGPLATEKEVAHALVLSAAELGRMTNSRTVEIRDSVARDGLAVRKDKVTLVLDLPSTTEKLLKSLGAKTRSQIRRADREQPIVEIGGSELVKDFFSVFAVTMRDLGTPVYPVGFFVRLLSEFASDCRIVLIRLRGQPAAAALLTRHADSFEVPWAASLHSLRSTSVNMRLYWECLEYSISQGARRFDFGRSTVDSGTYRFKRQWGAVPKQLYWYYPLLEPTITPGSDGGWLESTARRAWTKLPVSVANTVGAVLSPGLPW